MAYTIQLHLSLGLNFGSRHFLGGENLGTEEHPCPEDTDISWEGKMALVVCLAAVRTLYHGITLQ